MSQAKLQISIGTITFSGEGDEGWLASQLDKLLAHSASTDSAGTDGTDDDSESDDKGAAGGGAGLLSKSSPGTLAAFIASTGGSSSQVKRFLATAEWLHRKGSQEVKTSEVTKALTENHQKRLGNAADCLSQNVSKGHCEKTGSSFYVTDEGRTELGLK